MNNNQTKGNMTTTGNTFVFGTGKTTFPTQQFVFPPQATTKPTQPFGQTTQQPTFPTTFGQTTQQPTFPTTFGQTTQQPTFPTTFGQTTQQPQLPTTFGQTTQQPQLPTTFPQTTQLPTFPQTTQQPQLPTFPQTTQQPQPQPQPAFPTTFPQTTQQTIFQQTTQQPQPQLPTTFSQTTQQPQLPTTFQETKCTQIPTSTQSEIEDYLFSSRYNKDSVIKTDRLIHINTGLKIFTFQFDSKIKTNIYKLKEKNSDIEIVIRFENISPEFTEPEIQTLKIRPIGKTLFNHFKNKYEHCSFIEPCDGTIYNYFTKIKELIGQREFGSLKIDIPKIFQIVEQLRKNMVSLFELNNKYVYTNLTLDNIVYKCKNKNLNETEFKFILDHNVYPIDNVNKYITTYPPYEMKSGIILLDTKEKKEQTLSWYIGILLLMFVARHIPEFNSLNWIINNVSIADFCKLKYVITTFYGEKYSNYFSETPSERPSIYTSIETL